MSEALPLGVTAVFPCSPNQRQFLTIDAMGGGRTALNYAFRYQIDGPLRLPVLQKAFDCLLARHEILRTRFSTKGVAPLQEVVGTVVAPISIIDLSHLGKDAAHIEALELGRRDAARVFDLAQPPLVRLTPLRLNLQSHILLITAHATVIDGWSIGILVAELGRLIAAIEGGRDAELALVDIPYGDFARWQQAVSASGGFGEDLNHWKSELQGLQEFRLPATKSPPVERQFPSLTRGIILDRAVTDRAVVFARERGFTFYHVALAALAGMLHARTGSKEIVLGTQVSGRIERDAEAIVGPVLNPLVLRMRIQDNLTGEGFIECARQVSNDALSHQAVPFATVVETVTPAHCQLRNPLYAINFALQAAFIHEDDIQSRDNGEFVIHSLPSASHSALWDLNFGLVERPDGWRMSCEADGDLYAISDIDELLNTWSVCLDQIVKKPDQVIRPVATTKTDGAAGFDVHAARAPGNQASGEVHPLSQPARKPVIRAARLAVSRPDFIDDRITVYQPQASGVPVMALNVTSLYYPLATYDPNRAFYDIQVTDDVAPVRFEPRAIGDLAADAVRLIRKARPKGPYVLLAYCVTGVVALEAARQLRAQGEVVPLVVLVDTWRPGFREDLTRVQKRLRRMSFLAFRFRLDLERVEVGAMTRMEAIRRIPVTAPLRRLFGLKPLPDALARDAKHPNEWYIDHIHHGYKFHRPSPYEGRVLLVTAAKVCSGQFFPHDLGWKMHIAGGLDQFEVPGEHEEVLNEPAVTVLSAKLQEVLTQFDAEARSKLPFASV